MLTFELGYIYIQQMQMHPTSDMHTNDSVSKKIDCVEVHSTVV